MVAIVLKLLAVFLIVMALIAVKRPIYVAVTAGAAATWLLYGIPVADGLSAVVRACTSWDTLQLIVVMYMITFLQKMMGQRGAIDRAQKGLSALFNNGLFYNDETGTVLAEIRLYNEQDDLIAQKTITKQAPAEEPTDSQEVQDNEN